MENTQQNYIDEMLEALGANIEYLRKEGSSQLKVRNGVLIESIESLYIYEFELEFLQEIEPESEIEVRVNNESALGKVSALNEKIIQVELDKNLGASVPEAWLIISSYYLLQLLQEKLKKVISGEMKVTQLADKTFGMSESTLSDDNNYQIPQSKKGKLNNYQEQALRFALGSDVSFIWGPPGTGKTTTVARIIEGLINHGQSVLLIAHTNVAADGVLLSTVRHLEDSESYQLGKLVRIGNIQKKELSRFEMVIPDKILEKRGLPLKNELEKLTQPYDKMSIEIARADEYVKLFNRASTIQSEFEEVNNVIKAVKKEINDLKIDSTSTTEKITAIENRIKDYQESGTISRIFSGTNLEKLTHEKAQYLTDLQKISDLIDSKNKYLKEFKSLRHNHEENLIKLAEKLKGEDFEKSKQTIKDGEGKLKDLSEQIEALRTELNQISDTIVKDAQVVATTLTKSYTSKLVLSREYDVVIIDEASMAPLPAVWYAAGLAKVRAIIVGDFLQLPPITKHKVDTSKSRPEYEIKREEELVNRWLRSDIFNLRKIDERVRAGEMPQEMRQLKIQYRMHPDIAEVVNKLVYAKSSSKFALESDEKMYQNGIDTFESKPLNGFRVGIFDTSSIGAKPGQTDSGSYYNVYQALLAVELAKQAISSGYKSVGIISAYRAQTILIKKVLEDKIPDAEPETVLADTIHRFQGGERELMILDITTPNTHSMYDDEFEGGDDEKLLNVAFSRAQNKLIVIGNVLEIEKKHSASSLVKGYINFCREKNYPALSTDDMLTKYQVTNQSEKWLEKISSIKEVITDVDNSKLFDQSDFYPALIKDMLSAKQEVVIESPFIGFERIKSLLPILKHLINKNVNVVIITRPPKDQGPSLKQTSEKILEEFENMGIIVLPFIGYTHRKLAIIDRKILWEGSLNILSQRDSQEIMRRISGKGNAATQMMKFIKLDKNLGPIGELKIRRCGFCRTPGSWYWTDKSRFGGQWTFCLTGFHKEGAQPKTEAETKAYQDEKKRLRASKKRYSEDGVPICPVHEELMVKKRGPFGEFWGCPRYPRCKVTEKIKTPENA